MFRNFFANRGINLLTIHYGLQTFALGITEIFTEIYLYKIGIPLWMIFGMWSVIFFLRIPLRLLSLKLCLARGLRYVLIIGTLSFSLLFFILGKIPEARIWLVVYIGVEACVNTLYWFPYHVYFAVLGDSEHRGKQIALREVCMYLALFLAPLIGALIINFSGFHSVFLVAMGVVFLSVIPLFFSPEVFLEKNFSLKKAFRHIGKEGLWFSFGDGIFNMASGMTWKLVLFFFVGKYLAFGGLLSLAVLFQIIGVLIIGTHFDKGHGGKLYPIGIFLVILTILGRVFFLNSISMIIFLDFLFMLGTLLYTPIMHSAFYNTAKKSPHPLWFQLFAESGWDIGSFLVMLSAAIFLYRGGELKFIMLGGIIGVFLIGIRLRKYFLKRETFPKI